jgi:hypothetical protein
VPALLLTRGAFICVLRITENVWEMRLPSLLYGILNYSHLVHPSLVPHLKTVHEFVIYLQKCPIFNIINSIAPNVAFYWFLLLIELQFGGENLLLLECRVGHGNPGFNLTCMSCIYCVDHKTVEIFHNLRLFLMFYNLYESGFSLNFKKINTRVITL